MTDSTQAFWTFPPNHGALQSTELPPLQPGEVEVQTLYSALSRGTESLVYRGEVPESEYQRMRCPFQEGDFPGPVKYGYISVGRVTAGPSALTGKAVYCLYPHQARYRVPANAVVPLPAELPAHRAVLGANMETALNALWDAAPRISDRITVVGGGVVGLLIGWLCGHIPGCRVTLVDTNPNRRALADSLGLEFAPPENAPTDQDLVFHASGNPAGLTTALGAAGTESAVMELSWYGTRSVPVPLGEAFHARRLTLRSSQVGTVSPARAARNGYRERMIKALSLLTAPVLDHLITGESAFEELPGVLRHLSTDPGDTLCHRIKYR